MKIQLHIKNPKQQLILYILFAPLFCFLGCSDPSTSSELAEGPFTVFKNVNVIDAVSKLRSNQTVVISGNKIIEVGSVDQITEPKGSVVVDGTGKYLMPGLWDAHVHLTFNKEIEPSMFTLFMVNGITSIRDTGGQLDEVKPWKEKSEKNPESSPRVYIAGPLLDGLPNVYDGSEGRPEISVGTGSVEAAIDMVDSLAAAGVDLIKSYEMLTPEQFHAVVARAKEHGISVTGHVPLSMLAPEASAAGMRSMEHLRNLDMACSVHADKLLTQRQEMLKQGADQLGGILRSNIHRAQRSHAIKTFDEEQAKSVLNVFAENGTWQIPTLSLNTGRLTRIFDNDPWKETFRYLPEPARSQWNESAQERSHNPTDSTSIVFGNWCLEMIPRLHKAGVGIMAGTDTPIGFLTPGFSLHRELEMLVRGGLEPLQAIEAATLKPAQYFGLEDKLGNISNGMLADLILLDANPLADIKNTRKINAVMKDGHFYSRQVLDNMLNELSK